MSFETILVTGGAGYLGSRLIRDLARDPAFDGARIRILDNMQPRRYEALADLPDAANYQFLEGDILDPGALRRALDGVDAVVHLAALVRTPFSFDYPPFTEQVNHWGTAHLVEQCLEMGVRRFVLASSTSVYGSGHDRRETETCAPVGPYSQSKLGAENAVAGAAQRGLETVILRFATLYGLAPSMRFDAVPNRFAYLAATARTLPIHGKGDQIRPVVHVQDAARTIRLALSSELMTAQVYNVAAHNMSVVDMASAVRSLRPFVSLAYTAQDELSRFSLSVSGEGILGIGWKPTVDLRVGLSEILDRFGHFEALPAYEHETG